MGKVNLRELKGCWQADFTYRDKDGRMARFRRTTGKTRKEAEQEGNRLKRLADAKGYVPGYDVVEEERPDPLKMRDLFNLWFKNHVEVHNAPSEIANKKAMLRDYLGGHFRDKDIRDVTPADCEALQAKLKSVMPRRRNKRRAKLSPSRINKICDTMRTFFNWAVAMDYIDRSPARVVKKLQVVKRVHVTWTEAEAMRFLVTCHERRPDLFPFYATAALTGMRLGEIRALHWSDVSLDEGRIVVRRSLWRNQEKSTKNNRERVVTISESLEKILRGHQEAKRGGVYVFGKPTGGPVTRSSFRKQFHKLIAAAGVRRIRFHDLRHGFATMLKRTGADVKVAQELLGHSDPRMTLEVYQHNEDAEKRQAVNALLPDLKALLDADKTRQRGCQRATRKGHLRVVE